MGWQLEDFIDPLGEGFGNFGDIKSWFGDGKDWLTNLISGGK